MIDKKSERRYDDCIKYTMVASKKALSDAGLSKDTHPEAYEKLDKKRVGVLVGSGMGGLQVFQDGVANLVQKVTFISYSTRPLHCFHRAWADFHSSTVPSSESGAVQYSTLSHFQATI